MLHPESVACLKCIGKPLLASEDKTGFTHLLAFFWMLGMRLFVFCSKSKLLTLTSHYGTDQNIVIIFCVAGIQK